MTIAQALANLGRLYDRLLELRAGRSLYLVGGTIRDVLMGREPADFDFAVSGSGLGFARAFARKVHGRLVVLSEPDDEARVVCREGMVFDFTGFGDLTIEHDIRRRDFTVNALAAEIDHGQPGLIIDLVHGQDDIRARIIRPVSRDSLRLDPLRLLRAMRFALELGFEVAPEVYEQARSVTLRETAAERIGAELLRIMEQPGSYQFILRLFELGRLEEILPELGPVFDDPELRHHTFQTYYKVEELIAQPGFFARYEPEWTAYFDAWGVKAEGEVQEGQVETESAEPMPYRRALLKLAGLLHDIAKPETRFTNTDGEVHFYGHDSLGARIVSRVARERLRLSRAQTAMLKTLTAEHMRLHLLATNPDLTDRAVRRYFRDLGPEALGLMILCVADGWATAGRTSHLEDTIARMFAQKRQEDEARRIKRLVTGDDLIQLGLKPGPAFKVILQELEDLQLEGRITSKEQGIEYLKTHLTGLVQPHDS
ncbi:MAG: HD domain-containing protein [candidate division WOR-3 bacterium]